jgi:hypothetical protein
MFGRAAFAIVGTVIATAGMASCSATQPDQAAVRAIDTAQGMGTLSIRRRAMVWGAGPTYAVLLDGKPIVQLGASETKTVQVPAGAYEVEVRCGGETPDTTAKAQIMLGAGRSYQMDVYQTIDTSKQQPICQLRAVGS